MKDQLLRYSGIAECSRREARRIAKDVVEFDEVARGGGVGTFHPRWTTGYSVSRERP